VQRAPEQVKLNDHEIPRHILENYGNVTIGIDIMFLNRMPFLITTSRNIKFCTCEMIKSTKSSTILQAIKPVLKLYSSRGFNVRFLLMDGQFESIRKDLGEINVIANITARDEHVPEVERVIRTLKERMRSTLTVMPFKRIPNQMIVELIYGCIFWLNSFLPTEGCLQTFVPAH
jgi:hypothetical protein